MKEHEYDRNHVSQVLSSRANLIHPALSYGRIHDTDDDIFVLDFFLHCTKQQLRDISRLVNDDEDEVLLRFYEAQDDGSSIPISEIDKIGWNFSRPWIAKRRANGWDGAREISQPILMIIYN